MRDRAYRRHQEKRIRDKIIGYIKTWDHGRELVENPKFIGHLVSTHGRPCSCSMCASDESLTKQERLAELREKEQFEEL